MGDLFSLPAAQINRTITGTKALAEGETENPAAIAFWLPGQALVRAGTLEDSLAAFLRGLPA